ncbi:hypothetical protein [Sphingomonas oligophenolica]|uniref:hypothetical protein n=1 Tax=Sphingomonas oligophenolica TaxID=301154 RepID=UPI0031CEE896
MAFAFIAGGVVGGPMGTRIARRLANTRDTLRTIFGVMIFLVAGYMLWKNAVA